MKTLSSAEQSLASLSTAWMDELWDKDQRLLVNPHRAGGVYGDPSTRYLVRETCQYALGLLMRAAEGDKARALQAISSVLDYQFDEPGTAYHGTFYRSPEEAHPGENPVIWKDFDPNWRQFIGTNLALILIEFEQELPPELVTRIDRALELAVAGEPEGRVPVNYANIALMKAWLDQYVGVRFNDAARVARGETFAKQVYEHFTQHGAFEEYNSPTYYGIDVYALGLWRAYSALPTLRHHGAAMEARLWWDVARYYHAGLKNLSGPFTRSYGIDMRRYAALLGLNIWAALGQEHAPFPDVTRPFQHAPDFCFGPSLALVGSSIPADVLPHFLEFQGERLVTQAITSVRQASAYLSERVMLGGERGNRLRPGWLQTYPLTAHWQLPEGEVGWLRLVYPGFVDAVASAGRLTVQLESPQGVSVDDNPVAPDEVAFWVAPLEGRILEDHWSFSGLSLRVDTRARFLGAELLKDRWTIRYRVPEKAAFTLTLEAR